ncbi:hypothetical protein Tsubulata_034415 [Turnera subulata]|uniref:Uncharacterized protein n=1 Tax=Turnera subulata TaxID=218843 RepID=A0A9Q0GJD2_9ROSI|nr:hypothetical protein Tsubulata_044408 [Turnera subulata]KAJ4850055.1 hypothetical protein Tsubulata_034415 [Turnera subulata]
MTKTRSLALLSANRCASQDLVVISWPISGGKLLPIMLLRNFFLRATRFWKISRSKWAKLITLRPLRWIIA